MHRVDPGWLDQWLAVLERHVERASSTLVRAALAEMHAVAASEAAPPAMVVA
jgi:hypothetical protein